MRILFVATKAPWPPIDGGRVLLAGTLQGLAAAGHRASLVAPVDPGRFDLDEVAAAISPFCEPHLVPARQSGALAALVRARISRTPWTAARHTLRSVRRRVRELAATQGFDVVHAEQLQALPQAQGTGRPVVLRAQNVESDLWGAASRRSRGWRRRWLAGEAARLAAWEGEDVRRAQATVALTAGDAARLAELAGSGAARIHVLPPPFPSHLPPGRASLPGDPPIVVLGSQGWLPNEDSASWFLAEVWPRVRALLPGAVLHLFGMEKTAPAPSLVAHPPPDDSAEAFPAGAILAVPLRIASGVRMKILEAWARGIPVVATPEAVAGLGARHGRELLVGQDAAELAAALARLHGDGALARALVAAGRAALAERHDPERLTRHLLEIYAEAVAGPPARALP